MLAFTHTIGGLKLDVQAKVDYDVREGYEAYIECVYSRALYANHAVTVDYDHSSVPADADMMPLMQKSLTGQAEHREEARFRELWTARIQAILLDHGDDLVTVTVE